MHKPFPRSYWVEPGKLLAGFYPGDIHEKKATKKIQSLLDCEIRCFINLIGETETNYTGNYFASYNNILNEVSKEMKIETVYLKIPIIDQNITNQATMRLILDTIDNSIKNNLPVYVHCWGGIGRTGTAVGCWLIRHGFANRDSVFDKISIMRTKQKDPEAYREAPETEIQKEFVMRWGCGA